jgi:polyisoprenoid-binding protein YceI
MIKKLKIVLSFAVLLVTGPFLHAAKYQIDPVHSSVEFKVAHMVISKVSGRFEQFSGEFYYDEKNSKTWNAQATIDAASINTHNTKRDDHLRTADFFDVQQYPHLTFKSTKVTQWKGQKAKLHGLLKIHGVEKPVVLDLRIGGVVKDPWGSIRAGFEAQTTIDRKDFGIVWNKVLETGGLVVGDEVEITIHVEGIQTSSDKE